MEIHHAYKKICSMPFMKKGNQKVQGHYLYFIKIKLILSFEAKERIIIAGHSLFLWIQLNSLYIFGCSFEF